MEIKPFSLKIYLGSLVLVLILVLGGSRKTSAQTSPPTWTQPVNLSLSGSAASPELILAPDGTTLAVWEDQFDGLVYTKLVDGQWAPAQKGDFPFEDAVPQFVVDGKGIVHAFWLGQENVLSYSEIALASFGTGKWAVTTKLDEAASAMKVMVNEQDDVSLVYVHTLNAADAPAGLYFAQKDHTSRVWTKPTLLYASSYLRMLDATEIKLDLLEQPHPDSPSTLYLMWDNHLQAQIFLALSHDGGKTWDTPLEVRGPSDTAAFPNAIGMLQTGDNLLLLWQEKISETNCRQYYQTFALDGTANSIPQVMLSQFPICPGNNQLFTTSQGIVLQASLFGSTYWLAWNGDNWSEPQLQQELSNFTNPDTLQSIELQCLQVVAGSEDEVYLLACDNEATQGDIWFTSRQLTSTTAWFSSPSGWKTPASFFSTDKDISSVAVVADATGQIHAVWVQANANTDGEDEIYYARWDGTQWAYIVSIITPPSGRAKDLAAAVDSAGHLFLVWSGGEAGEIYFTWANANLAGTPTEWEKPITLPMKRSVGASPDIVVGENGTLYVAYAIPINEQRGIYLTTSTDDGATWSEPQQIMDAVAAGWETVDKPSLSTTATGTLQALFWQLPPPDGAPIKGLYQARSEDNGATWSLPEEVIRAELVSSWLTHFGPDVTYRLWQEHRNEVLVTYLEASPDLGKTWTEPTNFTDFDAAVIDSELVLDYSGHLRLIQLVDDTNAGLVLQEAVWDGDSWVKEERTLIDAAGAQEKTWLLQASVTSNGVLGVLITDVKNAVLETPGSDIYFTSRNLDETAPPPSAPIVQPTLESTLAPDIATPTETPAATPGTPQAERPASSGASSQPALDNTILGPIVGLVASGLLVAFAFLIFTKLTNRNG